MNPRSRRVRRQLGAALLASAIGWPLLIAAGCGGVASQPPTLGGESHFLERCEDSCEGGLDCIGGVCTKGCLVSEMSSCSGFPNAACTAESVEPGAVAVCDVACNGDEVCSAVGSAHRCENGYCRAPNPAGSMGAGGAGSSPSMGGSSGTDPVGSMGGTASGGASGTASGGAGGSTVDCRGYTNFYDPPPQLDIVVRNQRSTPVYVRSMVETVCGGYPIQIQAQPDGARLDLSSTGRCGLSCELVQAEGATHPGSTAVECPADCVPLPLVFIGAGEERTFRIDRLRIQFNEMPNDCFTGDFESVTCLTLTDYPPATYDVSLTGFTSYACSPELNTTCDCVPDAEGLCRPTVIDGTGEQLNGAGAFVVPAGNLSIDTSLLTVVLTYEQ